MNSLLEWFNTYAIPAIRSIFSSSDLGFSVAANIKIWGISLMGFCLTFGFITYFVIRWVDDD